MNNVLITGMSATGKSALLAALVARADTTASIWTIGVVRIPAGRGLARRTGRETGVGLARRPPGELLRGGREDVLFVCGCGVEPVAVPTATSTRSILLSAPVPLMVERLATRTINSSARTRRTNPRHPRGPADHRAHYFAASRQRSRSRRRPSLTSVVFVRPPLRPSRASTQRRAGGMSLAVLPLPGRTGWPQGPSMMRRSRSPRLIRARVARGTA